MSAARLNPEARLRLEKLAKVGPRAKSVTHSLKQQEAGSEKDSTGTPLRGDSVSHGARRRPAASGISFEGLRHSNIGASLRLGKP